MTRSTIVNFFAPQPPLQLSLSFPHKSVRWKSSSHQGVERKTETMQVFFSDLLDVDDGYFGSCFLWERRMLTKLRSNSEVSLILIWERSSYRSWDPRCLIWWLFALYHCTWENSQQSRPKITMTALITCVVKETWYFLLNNCMFLTCSLHPATQVQNGVPSYLMHQYVHFKKIVHILPFSSYL